jgi:predicted enzyme related to lactoylglutathione lyase
MRERRSLRSRRRPSLRPEGSASTFEILAPSADRACRFYRDVFGWMVGPSPLRGHLRVAPFPLTDEDATPAPARLVEVEDLDATIARIETHGGRVVVGKLPLRDLGWVAYCADPDGNVLCLRQRV